MAQTVTYTRQMIRAKILGVFLFVTASLNAQNSEWVRSFGGPNAGGVGNSLTVDASGNVYTTGYFEGTVDFDPGTGTSYLTSNGNHDVFVQKMNANGNFLWARSFGGIHDDESYSIAVTLPGMCTPRDILKKLRISIRGQVQAISPRMEMKTSLCRR
ncbi:MAG: SBBP repeat-containing protein [Flavobacteriales bacterium]|nr:SBBP repeat-containing protein [Flavobacteriales bacterium]